MVRTKLHKQEAFIHSEYSLEIKYEKKIIRLRRQISVILDIHPCKEMKTRNNLD